MTLNYTLSDYSQQIDEGFFDSLKQGFQSKYDQARGSQENEQDLQKYAQKAIPAIKQAGSIAQKYSKKVGIPLPLATAIVAAGIVGGPTAIPFAALMYFVRKPINKIAGKAFDAGAQKMGWQQPQQQLQPQPQPQLAWNLNSGMGFREYLAAVEMYEESWLGDKFTQARTWWNEKGADRLGGAIGKGAGYVSGKTAKYSANISNLIKSSYSALSKFAKENKLSIAKTAFLMAVGAAVGAGVGSAVNALTQGTDVVATTAVDAVRDSGTVPENDMEWLQQNFKPEVTANADGSYSVTGEDIYSTTGKSLGDTVQGDYDGDDVTDTAILMNGGDLLKTVNDELNNSDIFSSFTTSQPVEGPHPGMMVLQVHATITPQPGQGAEEVLRMAHEQLRQQLEEVGVTVQDFKPISYGQPDAPIQIQTTLTYSNVPGAAIGAAVGGAAGGMSQQQPQQQPQGPNRLQRFGSWLQKVNKYGLPSKNKSGWQ